MGFAGLTTYRVQVQRKPFFFAGVGTEMLPTTLALSLSPSLFCAGKRACIEFFQNIDPSFSRDGQPTRWEVVDMMIYTCVLTSRYVSSWLVYIFFSPLRAVTAVEEKPLLPSASFPAPPNPFRWLSPPRPRRRPSPGRTPPVL